METPLHRALKQAALAELARRGCAWAGLEVRGPMRRFRVDAAGLLPMPAGGPAPGLLFDDLMAPTMVVECKASRADFLCCTHSGRVLRRQRDALTRRRAELAATASQWLGADASAPGVPEAPSGTLFDVRPLLGPSTARLERRVARVRERLYAGAKFDLFVRYRLADRLLLLTAPGVLARDEVPPGWGWAEAEGACVRVRVEPPEVGSTPRWRSALHRAAGRAAQAGPVPGASPEGA